MTRHNAGFLVIDQLVQEYR
ncbi:hypothetical protein KA405_06360 [Patescibacteria group bacterium]|nr:hypothetical protein [Patescibacteria group bacterium]